MFGTPLQEENKNLLDELKTEIGCFIRHLIERPFTTQPTSRMWFRPEQLSTLALKRVKRYNQNKLEVEMAQLLLSILDAKENVREICFTLSDMQDWLIKKGFKGYDSAAIRRVLQDMWKVKPEANAFAYLQHKMGGDGMIHDFNIKGRFYKLML